RKNFETRKEAQTVIRNARMRPRVMVKAPTAFQGLAHPKGEVALWVRVTGIHGPAASPLQCGERSKPTTGKPAETGRHPTSCDVEGRVSVGIGSRLRGCLKSRMRGHVIVGVMSI